MNDIFVDNNFLSIPKIEQLLRYIKQESPWISTDDSWSDRFVHFHNIENQEIKSIVQTVYQTVAEIIEKNTGNAVQIETCQLVRWRTGDKLDPPHADCEHLDGTLHPYPNRHYSALVYLNDDYEGGQIFFPNQGLEPVTSPGTLVQFEGTKQYLHGVREITSGERYTIVMFFTRNND